jgi:hypothetical protein
LIKENSIQVNFPADFYAKRISGNYQVYYPADEGKDINQEFSIQDSVPVMMIPVKNHGQHILYINWMAGGKSYYYEQKIFL